MKQLIILEDIKVKYNNKTIFENISWIIEENTFITLCGKNGIGKSTLIKTILEKVPYDGVIKKENLDINKIAYLSENPNVSIVGDTVIEELRTVLKKQKYTEEEIKDKIKRIIAEFKLEKIENKLTTHLSGGEKQLVSFVKTILKNSKILILDNCFSMIDKIKKEKLIKYIKKYKQENKITIIHITNDTNDILYSDIMAILTEKELISGKIEDILKKESDFKENKLELPFMVDLSNKLKYYDLMDKPIYELDKMVNHLWK